MRDGMTSRTVFALVIMLLLGGGLPASGQNRVVAPAGSLIPGIPFSPGVRSGDLLYVAGTAATDASGKLVDGDAEAQTRTTLENIGTILKAGGLDYKDVVSVNVYLSDIRNSDAMARAYRQVFRTTPPVLSLIESALVLEGALVEISAIAADPGLPRQVVKPAGWIDNPLSSRAIAVGNHIFLAGIVADDPKTGKPVVGDAGVQTKQILETTRTLVQAAGATMADLTLARAWLTDGRDAQKMNDVYKTYFTDTPPTRATTRTHLAAPEYKVGMMFSGMRGSKQRIGSVGGAPLSPAIKVGDTLFVSGLVQGGAEVRGDIKGQTRGVLTQIENLLKQANMGFGDVVSVTIWLSNVLNFDAMNEVYREFFKTAPPSRATVSVGLLPVDGLLEMSVIAAK